MSFNILQINRDFLAKNPKADDFKIVFRDEFVNAILTILGQERADVSRHLETIKDGTLET